MTPLHTRLLAAEDHLRRTAEHLQDGLRAEILAHADAVAEAAADAQLEDTRLFLPVDFVRQQQAEMEARIKVLESEREEWCKLYRRDYGHDWAGRNASPEGL